MDPLRSLVRDAVAGDAGAMQRLIGAVAPSVLRLARVVLGPARADAEDVAQESLLGFVAALGGFRGECSVLHYACRITVRAAVAARRRGEERAQQAEELGRTAGVCNDHLGGEPAVAARRRALVRELLDELPEVCDDGVDNDCDELWDCADPDCAAAPECCVPAGPEACANRVDDDCDGSTDCSDFDCRGDASCAGCSVEICPDSRDNDCDGDVDCRDADCAEEPGC
ncbi:MAG: sigma-70 family RNA polymerase sigma factor [Deltaproteobacteria bacterium]|nr:sigma-70 family RNA polymerase sigma factor [Deltaproteobacteria bacterium]